MALSSNETNSEAMSSGRRFSIGANVTLTILLAMGLLVAINWICSIKSVRKDLAKEGNYGLSERTKRIVEDYDGEINLSLLYQPDEDDEKQQGYIERLLVYCDEMKRFAPNVNYAHVATDAQREKLVTQISKTFGDEADKHRDVLASFERVRAELAADLDERLPVVADLLARDSWLSDFPLFARVATVLRAERERLDEVAEEIKQLTPEGGIPKYNDATSKAKQAVEQLKKSFEAIAQKMSELDKLAGETTRPDSPYIALLRTVAVEAKASVDSLRQLIGAEDESPPDDVAAALKAYADHGVEVGGVLGVLVGRVDQFAKQYPMVKQHTNWTTQVKMGPLLMRREVSDVLDRAGATLRQIRLGLLGVIDTGDPAQLQHALEQARKTTRTLEQNVGICEQILTDLAERLATLDDASRQVLEEAREGKMFADRVASMDELAKVFEDLPELKLGSVADQVKQDNAVVIEANGKLRVVEFPSVWPVRDLIPGSGPPDDDVSRAFNGDSAFGSAILSLTSDKPFATIVLVSFEPPRPQQPNRFMPPPPPSSIPTRMLSLVRKRLDAANLTVVDWNLATTPDKPVIEDGSTEVFVLLPPAPAAGPSPFGGAQPPDQIFSEKHRKIIRDLLDNDARVLFMATWEVTGGGFMGKPRTPPYGYGPILTQDWGLRVDNATRMLYVMPDPKKPGAISISLLKFQHMPVSGFTDLPIGKPMKGTRFLVVDACPIERLAETPDGVNTQVVLNIPQREEYIGVGINEIIDIVNKLGNTRSGGSVELGRTPKRGPFDLLVTSERKIDGEAKGKIVVMGIGGSLRDPYVGQPVMAGSEKIRFDPPPTENLDLFVNALYWLCDRQSYIGRGPVPIPRIAEIGNVRWIEGFLYFGWPLMVFLPGAVLWYIRRR